MVVAPCVTSSEPAWGAVMTVSLHPVLNQSLMGPRICLDPVTPEDLPSLWQKLSWNYMRYQLGHVPFDEKAYAASVWEPHASGQKVTYVVRSETGEVVGTSSFLDIRTANRGLEIGSTWLHESVWGTHVNPEVKYLMLRHAFEEWNAVRVQLKTDSRNEHSQAAIIKLGATREGVLRHHVVMNDGHLRDTVMFSILAHEWPSMRDRLLERMKRRTELQP